MIRRHALPGGWRDRELPDAAGWLPVARTLRCGMDWRGNGKQSATGPVDEDYLPGGRMHDRTYVRAIIRSNRYTLLT